MIKFCLFLIIFIFSSNILAQSADTTQDNNQTFNPGDVIEAGEALIKIEVEKPQVQLFSQRIKPEFDEVNLEKSFTKEIMDEGQSITLQETPETQRNKIDVEEILNKNR
jgi:hypothetical protein